MTIFGFKIKNNYRIIPFRFRNDLRGFVAKIQNRINIMWIHRQVLFNYRNIKPLALGNGAGREKFLGVVYGIGGIVFVGEGDAVAVGGLPVGREKGEKEKSRKQKAEGRRHKGSLIFQGNLSSTKG
jgi:hypothetical protein